MLCEVVEVSLHQGGIGRVARVYAEVSLRESLWCSKTYRPALDLVEKELAEVVHQSRGGMEVGDLAQLLVKELGLSEDFRGLAGDRLSGGRGFIEINEQDYRKPDGSGSV